MDVTICGISAWQYHRTPPIVRDVALGEEALLAALETRDGESAAWVAARALRQRGNARDADRLICGRLLSDLKGVSLPIHVLVGAGSSSHGSRIAVPHRVSQDRLAGRRINLGNGLYVLDVETTLCGLATTLGPVRTSKLTFEACGIFCLAPQTLRVVLAQERLLAAGAIRADLPPWLCIYGFSDERGVPLPHGDDFGRPLPWAPSFDRLGRLTDLWKRSPLTSRDMLEEVASALGVGRQNPLTRALAVTRDGAASPLEVKANLLLCSGSWFGGLSWGSPFLNRRIQLTRQAQALAHASFSVADGLWEDRRSILEVNGEGYHADKNGFRIASGRTAALESMGYSVADITHEQMADLELFDTVLPTLAGKLGFELHVPTVAFLRRREQLHAQLFREPYEPDMASVAW